MINVEEHIGLARKIAWGYYKGLQGRYTYDEIESTAYIGLIKAANNFDETKGFKFSSYAIPNIKGEIQRMYRDDKWHCVRRGVPHTISSLNIPTNEKGVGEIQDLLEDENFEDDLVDKLAIDKLTESLKDVEKEVIRLRYYEGLTQKEVSNIVNMSQANVSRIERDTIKKMRKELFRGIAI